MEFGEKLQTLRKQKSLTQEELAERLYVSRAAVSKWESGRGYPNLDSLKTVANFFSLTIDELLSGDELLTLAEEDRRQAQTQLRDLVFGTLDCGTAVLLFLPFFGQRVHGQITAVSLLSLTGISTYLHILYFVAVFGSVLCGILLLALQACPAVVWIRRKHPVSMLWNAAAVLLFIISSQPYAATVLFFFLAIKAIMLLKRP